MKTRIVCALLLALMLLALAGCGKKEDHPQPEDPNVTQKEEAVPLPRAFQRIRLLPA